ncbi:MAG: hypothetical protein KBS96_06775 [Lachnospiraceae bacterium]|nr:hypothetical protein [Candidatus Colinaster scatohippi]
MAKKKEKKQVKKAGLSMRLVLNMFAIIPLVLTAVIIGVILVSTSSSELKGATHNSMLTIIKEVGTSFDYTTENNEVVLRNFTEAPIVTELLKNPNDAKLVEKAQQYTLDYFGKLNGWEGIYIADWDSKVLTHPAPPVVGKVMREGEKLEELRNAMTSSDGLYNVGIITSPASGQLIMSMYAPVYDENGTPIGYVGAGTFVNDVASHFSDVSALGYKSAYIYFVDSVGTMLYHPDESKIGNPVENAAVKGVVAKLEAGETPAPECVEYEYKGAQKYAAYYVGANNAYVAVLTADEKDVMANISTLILVTLIVCIANIVIFAIISLVVAGLVAKPLASVAKATETLSTGDVTAECNAHSIIKETSSVISAYGNLKNALMDSMGNVKESAEALNMAIVSVDNMTAENVDSISQINNAIDEVATTSQAVASNAQDMAQKAIELETSIGELNENVSTLYDASLAIKNANDEATDCMNSVHDGANESVVAVKSITDKIAETNAAITEIGTAVQAIETIAAQTNLLSLNASIEAARAGEAGRGFAVVADEIRTLADSSAMSAKEIKQIIENVIELSGSTVEISNRVFEVITKEQTDIETTQERFTILSDSVESSIAEINTIKQMADTLDQIKAELINTTSTLGSISEELGASAEEVAASCQTVTNACTDTQASTEEMRAINEHMSTAIEFFKLS